MSRFIDAEKARNLMKKMPLGEKCIDVVMKLVIDRLPTADVVEVVRCKDCVFCVRTKDGEYNPEDIVCEYFMTDGMQATDYCSYGKRREGKHNDQRRDQTSNG